MIRAKPLIIISSLMMILFVSNPVQAWERGWGWGGMGFLTGAMVGAQLASPYRYYGYPYYPAPIAYAAPPMVIQQPSVVYAPQQPMAYPSQQQQPSPPQMANQGGQNWYYCASKKKYYPYVRNCPEAWQSVSAAPPPPSGQ